MTCQVVGDYKLYTKLYIYSSSRFLMNLHLMTFTHETCDESPSYLCNSIERPTNFKFLRHSDFEQIVRTGQTDGQSTTLHLPNTSVLFSVPCCHLSSRLSIMQPCKKFANIQINPKHQTTQQTRLDKLNTTPGSMYNQRHCRINYDQRPVNVVSD